MKTLTFSESGMKFEFLPENVYKIEHSPLHKALGQGIKSCECVLKRKDHIIFLEAKSSFAPMENEDSFKDQIQALVEKFQNSMVLFTGLQGDRPYRQRDKLPPRLQDSASKSAFFQCVLIVRKHDLKQLSELDDVLNKALSKEKKLHCISDIKVLNPETAQRYGLIKEWETA